MIELSRRYHARARHFWRVVVILAVVVAAYGAGTIAPHASAADSLSAVVSELHSIRGELTEIRRALQRR